MGVLTLKGPVNCEDLRHETVPPKCPGTRVHPENVSRAGELGRDGLPQSSAPFLSTARTPAPAPQKPYLSAFAPRDLIYI